MTLVPDAQTVQPEEIEELFDQPADQAPEAPPAAPAVPFAEGALTEGEIDDLFDQDRAVVRDEAANPLRRGRPAPGEDPNEVELRKQRTWGRSR